MQASPRSMIQLLPRRAGITIDSKVSSSSCSFRAGITGRSSGAFRISISIVRSEATQMTVNPLPTLCTIGYQNFVGQGFGQGSAVKQNLRRFYSLSAINHAFHTLYLEQDAKPSLTLGQWIDLYKALLGTDRQPHVP